MLLCNYDILTAFGVLSSCKVTKISDIAEYTLDAGTKLGVLELSGIWGGGGSEYGMVSMSARRIERDVLAKSKFKATIQDSGATVSNVRIFSTTNSSLFYVGAIL